MSIDPNEFRRVLGHFATGVAVITGAGENGSHGMTVSSFASVSLDPPLVMFCPSGESGSWQAIKETGSFCVNVLSESQKDTCGLFASKAEDKFAGVDWSSEVTGSPIIAGSLAWIDCEIHAIHEGGDHDIAVGLVKALSADADQGGPLLFFQGGYGSFGGV